MAQTPAEPGDSNANLLSSPSGSNGVVFSDLMAASVPAVEKAATDQSSDSTNTQSFQAASLDRAADHADQDLAALAAASQLATRGVTLRAPLPSAPIMLQNLDMGGLATMIAMEFAPTKQGNTQQSDTETSAALEDHTLGDFATVAAPGAELNVQALIELAMATSLNTETHQNPASDEGQKTVLETSTVTAPSETAKIVSNAKTPFAEGSVAITPTKRETVDHLSDTESATTGTAEQLSELPKKNPALQGIVWFEDASRVQILAVAPAQNGDVTASTTSHNLLIGETNSLETHPSDTIDLEENRKSSISTASDMLPAVAATSLVDSQQKQNLPSDE
jgi:hypothetical protein